jgi:hypothetical protein
MSGWHPPLHTTQHPLSHLVSQSDLELHNEGMAYLSSAKARLADDHVSDISDISDTSDASGALAAAFEDFQEIQNRNTENWHRGSVVEVADDLAETLFLKGRVAEKAENAHVSLSDLGWADDFYRRAAELAVLKKVFYQQELGAFRVTRVPSLPG